MSSPMIIFLPVRNGGRYLGEAIGSIVAQTDPHWRLVVLENASTDDTKAVVGSFADDRIELSAADRPLDIVDNWQRIATWLIANDRVDALITTIGHDDVLAPGFVEGIRRLATANPDATLYQSAFDLIDATGTLIRPCRPSPQREDWADLAAALCWGIRDSYGTSYAFRARDYLAVGGFPAFPKLLYADHLLFIRLARLGFRCATQEVLCRYRLHAGSASSNLSSDTINAYVEGLDHFVEALTTELSVFGDTVQGRSAMACLLGREIAGLGRPVMRPLLTPDKHQRMARIRALYAALAPAVPPTNWIGGRGSRWTLPIQRIVDAAAIARVRWRERGARRRR